MTLIQTALFLSLSLRSIGPKNGPETQPNQCCKILTCRIITLSFGWITAPMWRGHWDNCDKQWKDSDKGSHSTKSGFGMTRRTSFHSLHFSLASHDSLEAFPSPTRPELSYEIAKDNLIGYTTVVGSRDPLGRLHLARLCRRPWELEIWTSFGPLEG